MIYGFIQLLYLEADDIFKCGSVYTDHIAGKMREYADGMVSTWRIVVL